MGFYSFLSVFYDDIFQRDAELSDFLRVRLDEKGVRNILDAGCATGEYSLYFNRLGYSVSGFDLSENMILQARKKNGSPDIHFNVLDMMNASNFYKKSDFDAVLILGNTLVHLTQDDEIRKFLSSVYKLLGEKGIIAVQILNYDYFLKNRIRDLPVLNGNLAELKRWYEYTDGNLILFHTEITELSSGQRYGNSITINAVEKNDLGRFLELSGFRNIQVFSGSGVEYDKNSMSLLFLAEK